MFLQEIGTDIVIDVNGRQIKAHKVILRSRCQYFAATLAGKITEANGNVICLPGYSYAVVHFALCHVYSGAAHVPPGLDLMELASLSDLLGLEGLKEVTGYALKTNYCHNFHKVIENLNFIKFKHFNNDFLNISAMLRLY
jgi:BTB/POZ domain-containing protein 8